MMNKSNPIWNPMNRFLAGFLFLLVLSLVIVTSSYPSWDFPGNTSNPNTGENKGTLTEKQLAAKEQKLLLREEQLQQQEASIQALMEVRTKLVQQLVDKFAESNLVLEIDSVSGAIRFSNGILFDPSEYEITSEGAGYLEEFIPAYFAILSHPDNRDYISEIIVEGHGDDTGRYIRNLELSQSRALAVVDYILNERFPDFQDQEFILAHLTANGRSFSQPIMTGGLVDKDRSRRVEFKFRLKDEETIKEMQEIFERTGS